MDLPLPGASVGQSADWAPVAAVIAGIWIVVLVSRLLRGRSDAIEPGAPAGVAEARPRAALANEVPPRALASLASVVRDVSLAGDRTSLAAALAAAVDGLFDPSQAMVFVAADDDGKEFLLAATAGRRDAPWPVGARLSDTTGRLGLVARRRVVMDEREFGEEQQLVRDQVEATEPGAFMVEVAAPVVVDDAALLIVSVGGSMLPYDVTRDRLAALTTHASAQLRGLEASRRRGDAPSSVSGRRGFAPTPTP
jgi:hypothetical protein